MEHGNKMAIMWNGLNSKYKRLLTESVWVAVGQATQAVGILFGIRMLTSYVTPNVYGKFTLLTSTLALGTGVFCFPFLQSIYRLYHEADRSYSIPALRHEIQKLLIYATGSLAVIIIITGSAYTLVASPAAFIATPALAALLCVQMTSAYETVFLSARRRQARYSAWIATESWLKPGAALLLVWIWQPSVDAILIGYITGAGLTLLMFHQPSTSTEHDNYSATLPEKSPLMRQIMTYAMPLFPLALVGWITSLGDRYIIGSMIDFNAVGIYAAAYGIALQPFNVAGLAVELTIKPLYFKAASSREHEREMITFRSWLIFTIVISIVGLGFVLFYCDWIANLLLGEKFRQASELMPWLAAGGGFLAISQVLQQPFYAHMQTRFVLYTQLLGAIASIVLCLLLIASYGLKGAAVAAPIYYGFQCLVAVYFNRKMIKGSP